MRILSRLLSGQRRPAFTAPLAPDAPFYAIGDVHGALSALETLLARIDRQDENATIVCVGDYIDRGDHSAEVLALLHRLSTERPGRFICLAGNHEEMMLDFLDDPEAHGPRWLRNGGLQTVAGFRTGQTVGGALTPLAESLAAAMGPAMVAWLRALPASWQSGNVAVTHAGASPHMPIADQPREVLTWGHPDFRKVARQDGIWVVHGHTIVDTPSAEAGRVAVDTGAYATGRLTAARVASDGITFLSNAD